jgi:arsenite methyltransferase
MAPRFIARQLSRPSGFMGAVIRLMMNRHNARMNAFAVRQLRLAPSDHVLEIGFGGGVTLPSLMGGAAFVSGVDRSHDVIGWARRRFSKQIEAGRADFRHGHVESLPFEAAAFDKVCTVNTVYFWSSLAAGFAEIHRVLKPRGRVAIGFLPKERMDRMGMPEDIFTTRSPLEVVGALTQAGFREALIARPEAQTPWNVVVATR